MTCTADHLPPAAVGMPRSLRIMAARFAGYTCWDAPPWAVRGSRFVFQVRSIPEVGLHHDALVGFVCGLDAVPVFVAAF
jgi:hypothetical protein